MTNTEEYKKRLEAERKKLLAQIEENPHGDFGSDVDEDEEADEAEELGTRLGINQEYKERLAEIDVALSKIENGSYGICENCGKDIEEEILKVSPESLLCKDCKRKQA